ncbi:MAG: accessory factor UbiK family protein [Gammaproteobacteria bacterium]|nr:accessory factor UbiK family protein [Gammaproteobacteria bacterium]
MNERTKFESVIRRILDRLPEEVLEPGSDLRRNLSAALSSALARVDLVPREEFEVQAELLKRTREKLDAIERRLQALETGQQP